jgi:hypothetical protein
MDTPWPRRGEPRCATSILTNLANCFANPILPRPNHDTAGDLCPVRPTSSSYIHVLHPGGAAPATTGSTTKLHLRFRIRGLGPRASWRRYAGPEAWIRHLDPTLPIYGWSSRHKRLRMMPKSSRELIGLDLLHSSSLQDEDIISSGTIVLGWPRSGLPGRLPGPFQARGECPLEVYEDGASPERILPLLWFD